MNGTVFASIFYMFSYLAFFSGLFLYKKTDGKQQIMTWLPLTAILTEFYIAFVAAVLNLIHIPVHLFSLGFFHLLIAGVLWFFILSKKEIQSYEIKISGVVCDILFAVALIVVILKIADFRWGIPELYWNYSTVDPAAHFMEALEVVNDGKIRHMFFAQLINGTFIELFSPWRAYDYYYQLYVLSDILQFILSGFMFYGVIRRYTKDLFGQIAALILPFIFLLGYPLNSTLYGFTYLGMSLYVIAAILVLTDLYLKDELRFRWMSLLFLMLGANAIFQCYALFMPATYLAMGFALLAKQYKDKKLFSLQTVIDGLSIFLLPVIFGYIYMYLDVFKNDGVTVGNALTTEGAMYRDLYSNFLFFVPIALGGFILFVKEHKNSFLTWFTPIFVCQMLYMFFACYKKGTISAYYFYKTHFLLWLLIFILIGYGLAQMQLQARITSVLVIGSWVFVLWILVSGFETKLNEANANLVPEDTIKASAFQDLISYDHHMMTYYGHFPDAYMDLYHYVYNEILEKGKTKKPVPIVSLVEYTYLYEDVTGQKLSGFEYWKSMEDLVAFFDNIKKSDYVCVLTEDCNVYTEWQDFFDQFEVVYETDFGKVIKIGEVTIEP